MTLHTAGRRTKPNAEHALKAPEDFLSLYADEPGADLACKPDSLRLAA